MNKRGIGSKIIFLVITSLVVILFVSYGISTNWSFFRDTFGESSSQNNLGDIKSQCSNACLTNSKQLFCTLERQVTINGKETPEKETCYSLSKSSEYSNIISYCSNIICEGSGMVLLPEEIDLEKILQEELTYQASQIEKVSKQNTFVFNNYFKVSDPENLVAPISGKATDLESLLELHSFEVGEVNSFTTEYSTPLPREFARIKLKVVNKQNQNNEFNSRWVADESVDHAENNLGEFNLIVTDQFGFSVSSIGNVFDKNFAKIKGNLISVDVEMPSDSGRFLVYYFYLVDSQGKWYAFKNALVTLMRGIKTIDRASSQEKDLFEALVKTSSRTGFPSMIYDYSTETWKNINKKLNCDFTNEDSPISCVKYADKILRLSEHTLDKSYQDPFLYLAFLVQESENINSLVDLEREIKELESSYEKNRMGFTKEQIRGCAEKGVSRYEDYFSFNAALRDYDSKTRKKGLCENIPGASPFEYDPAQGSTHIYYVEEVAILYGGIFRLYDNTLKKIRSEEYLSENEFSEDNVQDLFYNGIIEAPDLKDLKEKTPSETQTVPVLHWSDVESFKEIQAGDFCKTDWDCYPYLDCNVNLNKCVEKYYSNRILVLPSSGTDEPYQLRKDKIDIVIRGVGYSALEELKKEVEYLFKENDEENYLSFFEMEPFKTHQDQFNIWAELVKETPTVLPPKTNCHSSATVGGRMYLGGAGNQFLFDWYWDSSYFEEKHPDNLEYSTISQSLAQSLNLKNADSVIILYKKERFRSAAAASTFALSLSCGYRNDRARMILHEFGHSFGKLEDEYYYSWKEIKEEISGESNPSLYAYDRPQGKTCVESDVLIQANPSVYGAGVWKDLAPPIGELTLSRDPEYLEYVNPETGQEDRSSWWKANSINSPYPKDLTNPLETYGESCIKRFEEEKIKNPDLTEDEFVCYFLGCGYNPLNIRATMNSMMSDHRLAESYGPINQKILLDKIELISKSSPY
ncbi:MAG TPA: M64 family metallopeptidase [Candidatus Pacearchaeota archaeon]|nr:M64 family metallopeptidase [Candidatus Pacearchaeota archaeon]